MSLLCARLNPPLRDWQGRSAWILGASSGIGRATADALHRRGARVIVSARQGDALRDFERSHDGCLARHGQSHLVGDLETAAALEPLLGEEHGDPGLQPPPLLVREALDLPRLPRRRPLRIL